MESEVRELAQKFSRPPSEPPDGSRLNPLALQPEVFSRALQDHLLLRFASSSLAGSDGEIAKAWKAALPIALGSWARDELCPRSDVDLLFVGDVDAQGFFDLLTERLGRL